MSASNSSKKRKEETRVVETRARKKAREALDVMTETMQRKHSTLNLLGKDLSGPNERELVMIFRIYDRDNDGKVSASDLASAYRSMGKRPLTKKIQNLLAAADPEGNGFITQQAFVDFFASQAQKKAATLQSGGEQKPNIGDQGKEKEKEKDDMVDDEKDDDSGSESDEEEENFMKRTSSIIDFFTPQAGLNDDDDDDDDDNERDEFGNVVGAERDLGQDGAFADHAILVGEFFEIPSFDETVGAALAEKEFEVRRVKTMREYIDALRDGDYDETWIIPSTRLDDESLRAEFADVVRTFNEEGGGVLVWADNAPYFVHANVALEALYAGTDARLTGNTPAQKTLSVGNGTQAGTLARNHLVTTGLVFLYEGHTICYFAGDNVPPPLKPLATSSDGHGVIFVDEPEHGADGSNVRGRIAVDCGFTKLYVQFNTAGTARYLKNIACWLTGIDDRLRRNLPLRGRIRSTSVAQKQWHWQYLHAEEGGWLDWDADASSVVEANYQDYLQTKREPIRSIKSGFFKYSVNFDSMMQCNVQHLTHTQRPIRRIQRDVYSFQPLSSF
jgi:WWE domain/EF-hand domain pair